MKIERTPQYLEVLMAKCFDSGLSDMWGATQYDVEDNNIESVIAFEDRKEIFFWLLECALDSGQLRLMKNGEYLTGTTKELVQRFRNVFPVADVPDTVDDMNIWFYVDPCPAEPMWRYEHPDGRVQWVNRS
jgi:hypothetical protein